MFETRCGSTRRVLLIGPIAVKIPRMLPFSRQECDVPMHMWIFWHGLVGNLTEWANYRMGSRMPFLVRVYFSCGLFSVQKRERGRHPTDDEIDERFRDLSPEARKDLRLVDRHHMQPTNFIVNESGWHVVDYGDHLASKGITLARFFIDHEKEVTKAFSALSRRP